MSAFGGDSPRQDPQAPNAFSAPSSPSGFGSAQPATGAFAFGAPSSPGGFGNAQPAASGFVFGAPSSPSGFGSAQPATGAFAFGAPSSPGGFGSAQPAASGFVFGAPSSRSGFGSAQPATGAFVFGAPSSRSGFGSAQPANNTSPFSFGSGTAGGAIPQESGFGSSSGGAAAAANSAAAGSNDPTATIAEIRNIVKQYNPANLAKVGHFFEKAKQDPGGQLAGLQKQLARVKQKYGVTGNTTGASAPQDGARGAADDDVDDDDNFDYGEADKSQVCTLCYGSLSATDSKVNRPGNRSAHSACDTIRRELLGANINELKSSAARQWDASLRGQKDSNTETRSRASVPAPLPQSKREMSTRSRVALATFHEQLLATDTNTTALADGVAGTAAAGGAAATAGVAEELLLRTGKLLSRSAQKHEQVLRAIAVGELGVAGQFLLSHSIGCAAGNAAASNATGGQGGGGGGGDNDGAGGGGGGAINCAVCYDSMAIENSPGGLVSCLGGHALHAGCASELLLGGGACPECREPLFFAKIEKSEALAAAAAATAVNTSGEPVLNDEGVAIFQSAVSGFYYCGRTDAQGHVPRGVVNAGQKVCLSKDYTNYGDSASGPLRVGDVGTVHVNLTTSNTRVQVRSSSGQKWFYDRGALSCVASDGVVPVCGPSEGRPCRACRRWNKTLGLNKPKKVSKAALLAKQQTAQLRAELAAVQASRAEVNAQLLEVLTARRSKNNTANGGTLSVASRDVDSNGASSAPPQPLPASESNATEDTPPPLLRQLTPSSAATAEGLDKTVSDADVQRGRRLLVLAARWGNTPEAKAERAGMLEVVRSGDLDSAARMMRRRNADRLWEDALWEDVVSPESEWKVLDDDSASSLVLRFSPRSTSQSTGSELQRGSRFTSGFEVLDAQGRLWLHLAKRAATLADYQAASSEANSSSYVLGSDKNRWSVVVQPDESGGRRAGEERKRHLRSMLVGPLGDVFKQWQRAGWNSQRAFDSAFDASFAALNQVVVLVKNVESEANVDHCVQQLRPRVAAEGFEAVKVQDYVIGSGRVIPSGSASSGVASSSLVDLKHLSPPMQGWLCVRPGGPGTHPACVSLGGPRCFGCGEAFCVSADSDATGGGAPAVVAAGTGATPELAIGDRMLVKRTLAPVVVVGFVAPDQDISPSRTKLQGINPSTDSTGEISSSLARTTLEPSAPISVGAVVELSTHVEANGADALGGPLIAGEVGTVVEVSTDAADVQPYRVEVDGKSWWYGRNAIQIHDENDANTNASAAPSSTSIPSPKSGRARFVQIGHAVMAANRLKASPLASDAPPSPEPPVSPSYLTEKDFENEDHYKRYVKSELRVGMRARVVKDPIRGVVGDIVTFARDDGTFSPLFRWSNGEEANLTVSKVELIRDDGTDKSTVITRLEAGACSTCTFVNASHLSKCEMCGTALPKEGVVLSTAESGDRWLRVSGAGNNDVNGLWAVDSSDPTHNEHPKFKKMKDDGTCDALEDRDVGVRFLGWSGLKLGWMFIGRLDAQDFNPYHTLGEEGRTDAMEPPLLGWQKLDECGLDPMPTLTWLTPSEVAKFKLAASFKAAANQNLRILCIEADAEPGDLPVSYRPTDLITLDASKGGIGGSGEELRNVEGALRTRKETLLICQGDEASARRMWSAARAPAASNLPVTGSDYASCLHGHFLHARCFQAVLLQGEGCPACAEPLWVPKVNKRRTPGAAEDDDCGHGDDDSQATAAMAAANALEDALSTSSSDNSAAMPTSVNGKVLKMCSACFAGPLLNEACADLRLHHGECPRCKGRISNAQAVIAKALTTLGSGKTVGEVLPTCPNSSCKGAKVFFNGCQACGHLFAVDGHNEWDKLPKWDPKAAETLDIDEQARKAARLIAAQVRSEAGYLAHERQALLEATNEANGQSLLPAFYPIRPPKPSTA